MFRGKLEVAKDFYDKSTAEILRKYLDRWILFSQWAGHFGQNLVPGFGNNFFLLLKLNLDLTKVPSPLLVRRSGG